MGRGREGGGTAWDGTAWMKQDGWNREGDGWSEMKRTGWDRGNRSGIWNGTEERRGRDGMEAYRVDRIAAAAATLRTQSLERPQQPR